MRNKDVTQGMPPFNTVAVVGAGAWGTALANAAARAGRNVTLIARDSVAADKIAARRQSPRLDGVKLDPAITVSGVATDAALAQVVLLAVPAQASRVALTSFAQSLSAGTVIVACAKGIERDTRLFMTEIIASMAPQTTPAILSGPSFADDVARGLPTAVTLATRDETIAAALCQALGSPTFRPYHTSDVRGVEIGGAAKNVLAIAAGIVVGRNLGASALAALTTRGFAELTRFGRGCGAQPETLAGLSGLGDLLLSCSSPQSRNFSFGIALGQGQSPVQAAGGKLAEGAFTAAVLLDIARANGIDMPISEAVASILEGRLDIDTAINGLLARPLKAEG
jgi:glycerol-3-phosphate dehydrogenase (NAD(P)+)